MEKTIRKGGEMFMVGSLCPLAALARRWLRTRRGVRRDAGEDDEGEP
jgi:hypothetical protein